VSVATKNSQTSETDGDQSAAARTVITMTGDLTTTDGGTYRGDLATMVLGDVRVNCATEVGPTTAPTTASPSESPSPSEPRYSPGRGAERFASPGCPAFCSLWACRSVWSAWRRSHCSHLRGVPVALVHFPGTAMSGDPSGPDLTWRISTSWSADSRKRRLTLHEVPELHVIPPGTAPDGRPAHRERTNRHCRWPLPAKRTRPVRNAKSMIMKQPRHGTRFVPSQPTVTPAGGWTGSAARRLSSAGF
jgi:hypothetical protein